MYYYQVYKLNHSIPLHTSLYCATEEMKVKQC